MKQHFIFFALILLTSFSFSLTEADIKSWWKFDTNTAEVTPDYKSFNNGTAFGALNLSGGLFGNDYNFKNPTDRIDLNQTSWRPDKNFSINAWVKTINSSGNRVISIFNTATAQNGWIIDCGGTTNAPRFGIGNGASFTYASITDGTKTCDTGNWRMITATYDGNSIKIYVDGTFAKDASSTTKVVYGETERFTVGAFYNAGSYTQTFTGQIDEVSVYENTILTPTDITELWNSGVGESPPFAGTLTANFTSTISKSEQKIILKNTSTGSVGTITNWIWSSNDINISLTEDYNYPTSPLLDLNICLQVYSSTLLESKKCSMVYTGDWNAPTTTLSTSQYAGESKQKLTFTCTDNNAGCKWTNYNIDNNVWITANNTGTLDINYLGGGSHTIQYYSTDNSDNNETTKSGTFTTYGFGKFYFKDENSGNNLTNVQVNFNGTDYNSGANNYLDFNFQTISGITTTYLLTLSKSGYSTRYYQTDLNQFADFNVTFALLPNSIDADIPFKVYQTDQSTIFTNTFVEIKDSDTNYTIGKLKTDSTGNATFNLRENDSNYNAIINDGQYTYTPVTLTILYPKNEETLIQITEKWRIQITQNLFLTYSDLNTNKVVYLLPNTTLPFKIKVSDMNGNYYPRTYSKTYPGNPLTDTLQPYLISVSDAYPTSIYVKDATTNNPIQNVTLAIYLQIETGYTLIEQVTTDASGSAKVSLIQLTDYYFDVYNDDTTWYTKERKQAINNEIYFYLVQEATDWNYNEPISVFNTFSPGYYTLSTISYDRIIRIKTACNQTTTDDYNLNIFQKGNIIYNYHTTANQCSQTNVFTIGTDFNIPDYNYPIQFVLKVIYNDDSNVGTWVQEYMVASPYLGFDVFKALRFDLKQEMGCSTSNNPLLPCVPLLVFFVIFLVVSAVGVSKAVGFSVKKIGMLVIFELLFFTGIGFVPIGIAVILGAITFLAAFVVSTGGEF